MLHSHINTNHDDPTGQHSGNHCSELYSVKDLGSGKGYNMDSAQYSPGWKLGIH